MIKANDPTLTSWVAYDEYSDFPIQNIPFGIGNRKGESPRVLSAIGDFAVDLVELDSLGYLDIEGLDGSVFHQSCLNNMIATGKDMWSRIRGAISEVLRSEDPKNAKAEKDK